MNPQKAMYAAVGAPFVAGRRLGELKGKMIERTKQLQQTVTDTARKEFERMAEAGEKTTKKLRNQKMVEDLSSRVDFDQISGQVTKLRDQLETVLKNWKAGFQPEGEASSQATADKAPAPKSDRTSAKSRPASKKRASAAKKPVAKKAAAAKKPAAKKSTTTRGKASSQSASARTPRRSTDSSKSTA